MRYLLLIAALSVFIGLGSPFECNKNSGINPKTYNINLDLPPRQRFKQVTLDFKDQINSWVSKALKVFLTNKLSTSIFSCVGENLIDIFPYPYNEEIRGIAETLNISTSYIVMGNLVYDFTSFQYCTSIVAQKKNGQIIHGRNLDFDPQDLKNMTYIAKFYRKGKLVFTSAQLAGYIGIITGQKYNNFTFSVNERGQGSRMTNFQAAIYNSNAVPLAVLGRRLMEEQNSFDDAIQYLSSIDLIAPVYFIIGGVKAGQGAVISRSQNKVEDIWKLYSNSEGMGSWYVLETNYDHWTEPPTYDDRVTPGKVAMDKTNQSNISYKTLLDVLTVAPVCNETIYSVTMSAGDANGFMVTVR